MELSLISTFIMEERTALFFQHLNRVISAEAENDFKNLWWSETYSRNISGPEAISGEALFTALCNAKAQIEPNVNDIEGEDPAIIGCFIRERSETDADDYCYLLLQQHDGAFCIRACSNSKSELEGLLYDFSDLKQLSFDKTDSAQDEVNEISLEQIFDNLNKAISANSEKNFSENWFNKAYYHNLSGEGGLSGHELFTRCLDGKWQMHPQNEYISSFENPEAFLIPVSIWLSALEMEKPGDEALMLLLKNKGIYSILGYGTDLSSMRHLYLKYKEGTI